MNNTQDHHFHLRCYQCRWHCGFNTTREAQEAAKDHLSHYPGHTVERTDQQDLNPRKFVINRKETEQ